MTRCQSRAAISLMALLLCASGVVRAQSVTSLAEPTREILHPEEFTSVRSARVLADGRLLVVDVREKRLVVLDWARATATTLGRRGDGPAEYRSPRQVLALPADSTLLVDAEARRWHVLVGARFAGQLQTSDVMRLSSFSSPVLGADAAGHALFYHALPSRGEPAREAMTRLPHYAESLLVVRAHRTRVAQDTVARLIGRPWGEARVQRGGAIYTLWNPLAVPEQALLFLDGWIARVTREPYRVVWLSPEGEEVVGPPIPSSRTPASNAEREFAAARVQPMMEPPRPRLDEFPPWPTHLPAFTEDALFALPDGRLAVGRMPSVAAPEPRYDILDRRGRLVAVLVLEGRQRLLGFGDGVVFTITTDADGIERVARHVVSRLGHRAAP